MMLEISSSQNLLSGCLGVLAFSCGLLALTQKSESILRALSCAGAIIWAGYFWSNNSYTAAILALVIGIRLFAAYTLLNKSKPIKIAAMLFFQLITIICTYITWHGYASLLVWFAASLATYGFFMVRGPVLRYILIGVDSLWLLHDFITSSIIHAIATIIQISINIKMATSLKTNK